VLQTCQAEALAPDVMNQILRRAIEQRIDRKALERVLKREKRARREARRQAGRGVMLTPRFSPLCGLKSDISRGPKSASSGPEQVQQ